MFESSLLFAAVLLAAAGAWQYVFGILMFVTSLFLILLVLVQRGRGGGLAGAFGGMGGQSAFGTKAGDLFTRITIGVAAGWILLCICAILVLNRDTSVFGSAGPGSAIGSFEDASPADGSAAEGDATPSESTESGGSESSGGESSAGGLEPAGDAAQDEPVPNDD